jgi:hypothetical protein
MINDTHGQIEVQPLPIKFAGMSPWGLMVQAE